MSTGIYNKHTGYHNRRSIRLRGFDYSQPGHYFITICIHDHNRRLFGDFVGGDMVLNELGKTAYNQLTCLPERFPTMKSDVFQIMSNHVHAVISIIVPVASVGPVVSVGAPLAGAPSCMSDIHSDPSWVGAGTGAGASPAPTGVGTGTWKPVTLGDIVGAYKSLVANECLKIYKSKNERMGRLWQRNYYDHIVRDVSSLYFIRKYIRENPMHWIDDMENHIAKEIDEFNMEEVQCGR